MECAVKLCCPSGTTGGLPFTRATATAALESASSAQCQARIKCYIASRSLELSGTHTWHRFMVLIRVNCPCCLASTKWT
eukprot:4841477-Prymnesium_polylepis.1